MPVAHFFWMLESSRTIHARRMSEWAEFFILPAQHIDRYHWLKTMYQTEAPELPPEIAELTKPKPLSGTHAQAAMIDLFRGKH